MVVTVDFGSRGLRQFSLVIPFSITHDLFKYGVLQRSSSRIGNPEFHWFANGLRFAHLNCMEKSVSLLHSACYTRVIDFAP